MTITILLHDHSYAPKRIMSVVWRTRSKVLNKCSPEARKVLPRKMTVENKSER